MKSWLYILGATNREKFDLKQEKGGRPRSKKQGEIDQRLKKIKWDLKKDRSFCCPIWRVEDNKLRGGRGKERRASEG